MVTQRRWFTDNSFFFFNEKSKIPPFFSWNIYYFKVIWVVCPTLTSLRRTTFLGKPSANSPWQQLSGHLEPSNRNQQLTIEETCSAQNGFTAVQMSDSIILTLCFLKKNINLLLILTLLFQFTYWKWTLGSRERSPAERGQGCRGRSVPCKAVNDLQQHIGGACPPHPTQRLPAEHSPEQHAACCSPGNREHYPGPAFELPPIPSGTLSHHF